MKKYLFKWKAFLLAFILSVTILPAGTALCFAAAKPAISVTSKTVIGVDQEFKLTIKNLPKTGIKSTSWSSTNKKVATVYGGEVTAAGKGTAAIKCRITYKSGKVVTLSCKVTVKIPAAAVEITNAQDDKANNSRQVIAVGDTYDFNSVLTPANADNYITYTISNTDIATVDNKGIVKGKKPGFVTLTARAKLTKPADYKNNLDNVIDLKDSINLEIVTRTAKVTDVELLDTTTLKVTFDEPIDEKTVLSSDKKLLNNISIITKSDKNGVIASSLGTLTGSLSADGKILTISTGGYFNGLYGIKLSNNILTKDSEPLMEYYKELSLYDTTPPGFKDFTVDDTGLVATINFTEAINFSGLKIEDVELVTKNTTAKSSTVSRLGQKSNYKASSDGKSLTIDLTQMSTLDRDKEFMVVFSGLKDRAGNYPDNDRITAYLATDTKPKAQARVVSVVRTDGNTLTATFTRAIQTPGNIQLSNGMMISGTVNQDNNYQVKYTLDSESAKLSGNQTVYIGFWDSYNVNTSDNSADTYTKVQVNFTIITELPELIDHQFTVDMYNGEPVYTLLLFYNKEVEVLDRYGSFSSRLITDSGTALNDYYIGYTADADGTIVTVVLDKDDMNGSGSYVVTIPEDFIEDEFGNTNIETTVKLENADGSSSALPKPRAIVQSTDDASVVYVTFANKLDEDSAQNESNYYIAGAEISSAELIDNSTSGATVKLTLAPNSIYESTKYSVTISGISGYHNSYTEMEPYTTLVFLRENTGPGDGMAKYTYPDIITITFNENISGTASFQVMQNGKDLVDRCTVSGNKIIITLDDVPVMDQLLEIIPTSSNRITDVYGNPTSIGNLSLVPTK